MEGTFHPGAPPVLDQGPNCRHLHQRELVLARLVFRQEAPQAPDQDRNPTVKALLLSEGPELWTGCLPAVPRVRDPDRCHLTVASLQRPELGVLSAMATAIHPEAPPVRDQDPKPRAARLLQEPLSQ